MKTRQPLFLTAVLCGAFLFAANAANAWDNFRDASWNTTSPITTEGQLAQFAWMANGGNLFAGKTVTLGADIDLAAHPWAPIGNFRGVFDGQGHTISGMKTEQGATGAGFFKQLEGTAKNVSFAGANVKGNRGAGVVAGCLYEGVIQNVTVTGSSVTGEEHVGGIAGVAGYGSVIRDSQAVNITVTASATTGDGEGAGGIAGFQDEDDKIENCSVSGGTVTSGSNSGGIVGYNLGVVNQCSSSAAVSVVYPGNGGHFCGVGGIAGTSLGKILNCLNRGTVKWSGAAFCFDDWAGAGGIAGRINGAVFIANSFNSGSVTSSDTGVPAGGIVGKSKGYNDRGPVLCNCYNSGAVSGPGPVGGVMGQVEKDPGWREPVNIHYGYWKTGTAAEAVGSTCGTVGTENLTAFGAAPGTLNAGTSRPHRLLSALNAWVFANSSYAEWTTTGSPDRYPVLFGVK